LTQKSNLIGRF